MNEFELIRHYFAGRDELVAAAFDHAVTAELASDEQLLAGLDPIAALAAWFSTTPEDHYLVWIDAWSEAPRNPALAAALERHHRDCERILADVIRRAVAAGAASSTDVDADSRMLTALADGYNIVLTADVPKVSRRAGLGIVKLAQHSGRPIYPLSMTTSRRKELDNWDRTAINLPFGRMYGVIGEPIRVPRDADDAALEAARLKVEQELNAASARAKLLAAGKAS